MLQTLTRMARMFSRDGDQLALDFASGRRPRTARELETELRRLGLRTEYTVRLTKNRTVVVSYGRSDLRIHQGFLDAPEDVWRAIVGFAQGRTRAARADARRAILEFPVVVRSEGHSRRPHRTHTEDCILADRLTDWHARYNRDHFDGKLRSIKIGISRRMKSRLGHYSPIAKEGAPGEIVISRRHFRRHGWDETLHTLLHEMVHQWQDENSRPIDHGPEFRRMARAVGVEPYATRRVA